MRIRTIKPEFWLHEGLCGCSEFARLLAIALLNWSDDEGYFMAHPSLIRGSLFPFLDDSKNIPRSLQDLSRVGWIELGKDDQGRPVGRVTNFLKHQRIDKPQASKIKGSSVFLEPSKNDLGTITDDSQGEWNGLDQGKGSGNGVEGGTKSASAAPTSDDDWLKSLDTDPTYAGINIMAEYGKMSRWCEVNKKQPSRRRFINWLNRVDRPIKTESAIDPRRAEFLAIFTECYHAFTDKAYPLGDNDMESLSSLLSALPDLTAETWREALEWCQDTAQKEGRYAPKIISTGNLAAFCSNWSGIVAYSQTYQEPKK